MPTSRSISGATLLRLECDLPFFLLPIPSDERQEHLYHNFANNLIGKRSKRHKYLVTSKVTMDGARRRKSVIPSHTFIHFASQLASCSCRDLLTSGHQAMAPARCNNWHLNVPGTAK
jgi:hypothetical protein